MNYITVKSFLFGSKHLQSENFTAPLLNAFKIIEVRDHSTMLIDRHYV